MSLLAILAIIFLVILIALIVIIVMVVRFINQLRHWRYNVERIFDKLDFPADLIRSLPDASTFSLPVARMGIAAVMTAVNNFAQKHLDLPAYLRKLKDLPNKEGIILAPNRATGVTGATGPTAPAVVEGVTGSTGLSAPAIAGLTGGIDLDPHADDIIIVALRDGADNNDLSLETRWSQVDYHGLGTVHRGFAETADRVYDTIASTVPRNGQVILYGHGTGAAVAELVGARLFAERRDIALAMYLSGKPRVGDGQLEQNIDKIANRWYLINTADDVPNLILPTMIAAGAANKGYGFSSSSPDRITAFEFQTGDVVQNHSLKTYQHALNADITEPFKPMWQRPLALYCRGDAR